MSPRRRKVEDRDVFSALARVMMRRAPDKLTLREIAAGAGVTAGALVQRFGSKRAMLLAYARHVASTGDTGLSVPRRSSSPLAALSLAAEMYAELASSPSAAVRNLAYLLNDLSDPTLRRHLLKTSLAARAWYEQLLTEAIAAGELRGVTNVAQLSRLIEATLRGSFLSWAVYREGPASDWLRSDLNAVLKPYKTGNAIDD